MPGCPECPMSATSTSAHSVMSGLSTSVLLKGHFRTTTTCESSSMRTITWHKAQVRADLSDIGGIRDKPPGQTIFPDSDADSATGSGGQASLPEFVHKNCTNGRRAGVCALST